MRKSGRSPLGRRFRNRLRRLLRFPLPQLCLSSSNRKRLSMPTWFRMMFRLQVRRSMKHHQPLRNAWPLSPHLNRRLGLRLAFPGSFRRIGKPPGVDLNLRCGGLLSIASRIRIASGGHLSIVTGSRIPIGSGVLLRVIVISGRADLRVVHGSLRSSVMGSGLHLSVGRAVVRRVGSSGPVDLAPGDLRAGRAGIVHRSSLVDRSGLLNPALARRVALHPGVVLLGEVRRAADLQAAVSLVRRSGHFVRGRREFWSVLSAAP